MKWLGSIKLTASVTALVVGSIAISTGVVTSAIYFSQSSASRVGALRELDLNLDTAVAIAENSLPGAKATWTKDGTVEAIEAFALPRVFADHGLTDGVERITDEPVILFVKDPATGFYTGLSSSFVRNGERVVDITLQSDAIIDSIETGRRYLGELSVMGRTYFVASQPILLPDRSGVLGAIAVLLDPGRLDEAVGEMLKLLLLVGGAALGALGILGLIVSRAILRPVPLLSAAMQKLAEGNLATFVPFVDWPNEIGSMARAVEIFRESSRRVAEMTDSERDASERRRAERAAMMHQLQRAFGDVVDASAVGDFSKRVGAEFSDAELNDLALGINKLIETVHRGLAETGAVLSALARTDLSHRVSGHYEGAFAKLKDDTNTVAERLSEIVLQLKLTSNALKSAMGEILTGANDLSDRTMRQAATIKETSAAMEEIASTVIQSAQQAREASRVSDKVAETAEDGKNVMQSATDAMARIASSSGRISTIIGLIDDIAFQTNLLALNASVEAARAGDAGTGFAVVAVEVRRLAHSAAQASAEVKVLIDQSSEEVRSGSSLVSAASDKLSAMSEAARASNSLMSGIAKVSLEQASAIEMVNRSMRELDEMTQKNAAIAEQATASIEQTEAHASRLDKIVDIFTVVQATSNDARSKSGTVAQRGKIVGLATTSPSISGKRSG